MKKNYIIDGYNLGYKIPSVAKWIRSGETDRAIQLIKNFANKLIPGADQIIIVFDGTNESKKCNTNHSKLQIRFSKKPQTADDIIRQFIRYQKNASKWIVVSSDSDIRHTAEDMGADVICSEKLIESLKSHSGRSQGKTNREKYRPDNVDIDFWLDKFNQSGENKE